MNYRFSWIDTGKLEWWDGPIEPTHPMKSVSLSFWMQLTITWLLEQKTNMDTYGIVSMESPYVNYLIRMSSTPWHSIPRTLRCWLVSLMTTRSRYGDPNDSVVHLELILPSCHKEPSCTRNQDPQHASPTQSEVIDNHNFRLTVTMKAEADATMCIFPCAYSNNILMAQS